MNAFYEYLENTMEKKHFLAAAALSLAVLTGCAAPAPQETEPPTTEAVIETTVPVTEPPTEETAPPTEPAEIVYTFFNIPTGFAVDTADEAVTVYRTADEADESSITVAVSPRQEVLEFTEKDVKNFLGGYISLNEMQVRQIRGRQALIADYARTEGSHTTRCISYLLAEDQTYCFTFADATVGGDWAEAFAGAGHSIQLLEEGQYALADRTGLWWYDFGCGMQIYACPDLKTGDVKGYDGALIGDNMVILLFTEAKSKVGEGFTLEEYADAVTSANGLTKCEMDAYGGLSTTFNQSGDYYYMTVKESEDAFWICQMTCPEEAAAQHEENFHRWGSTIGYIG